jgi:serine/threonine protein kinase
VLVRFDERPNVPRILLFDLGIISDVQSFPANWYSFCVPPAYTAPELMDGQATRPGYATDVYGLGLTLYELLVGQPAFPNRLESDDEVYRAVQRNRRVRMNRVEDVKPMADIALQAVDPQVSKRQQSAGEMVEQLLAYFGEVPGRKQRRLPSLNTILIVVGATLAVAFLIALAASLSEFPL